MGSAEHNYIVWKSKERYFINLIKRVSLLALSLVMMLGLASCDTLASMGIGVSKPDMPMEITIDNHTIVLGQTTTAEMAGWGWDVGFYGSQNEIKEDAKYVACYYTIRKSESGSGDQFSVAVWVPFQKNFVGSTGVDFSEEEKMSKTEGVVCRVTVRKDAAENFTITYNGMNYQDLTWDDAKEWGATETDRSNEFSPIYELEASQGTLTFEKGYTGEDEPGEFSVSMNSNAFAKLQK